MPPHAPQTLNIRRSILACQRLAAPLAIVALLAAHMAGCHKGAKKVEPAGASTEARIDEAQRIRLEEAMTAKEAGEYDKALELFQAVLAQNNTITTAYLGIGDIYVIKRDYERAEPAYGRAARLEPRNFDAQYGHGLALQMLQRFVDAVRAYQRALTINPESFKANLNIATTYLQMSDARSAVAFAEKAVQVDPSSGPAHVNLGAAYEKIGRNADAITQYLAALEIMDNSPPLMMNLINILAQEKRYQEAANAAETLVKIEPSANAYERLGWCYFRMSSFDKSQAAYSDAVKVDPGHWQSFNGIGVNALNTWILSKKQDHDAMKEARDAFRKSLQINTNQPKLITLMANYGL